MIRYDLHDEPVGFYNIENYKWLITDYYNGSWDGTGDALACTTKNILESYNLSHCSCYGPFDNGLIDTYTIEELFGPRVVLTNNNSQEILDKARELLIEEGLLLA